jgi:hypothetical protein
MMNDGAMGRWLQALPVILGLAACQLDDRQGRILSEVQGNEGADASVAPAEGPGGPEAGVGEAAPEGARLELPTQLSFGSVATGSPALRRIRVRNGGDAPLGALAIELGAESAPELAIAQNQCPTELGPGAVCDVRLQFLPAQAASVRGELLVSGNGQQASVALTGLGVESGELLLLPAEDSSADFGALALGSSLEAVFRIDNPTAAESGPLSFDLANPEFTLREPALGECEAGVTSLPAGAGCVLRVAFEPTERGVADATLTAISENMGGVSLALRGDGRAPAALALAPEAYDFGGVVLGGAGQASVTVTNAGDLPLALSGSSLAASSDAGFSVLSSSCGAGTVLGGSEGSASCRVDLEFRPDRVDVAMGALSVTAEGGLEATLTLRGEGLLPGSLIVEPAADESADFGSVVVGEPATRRFRVENPGAEPSGAIDASCSGGFAPLPPAEPGDCVPGTTTLAGGESCFVTVQLTPSVPGPIRGSLTISSALAGNTSVDLTATALRPATLLVDRDEIDFGRVVRGTTVEASLTVRNDGDVDLPVLEATLGRALSGQVSAFSVQNACDVPLGPGLECSVALSFSPQEATPHSVNLTLASGGDTHGVLLVARVIEPGSLVLEPAPGSSGNFGDVAINASATRQFSLTNPGGEPSGRLSISANDARFGVSAGDCSTLAAAGLVDGESCTISVTFTPNSSEAISASLTVSSPGAGSTALPLAGRGRNPARLAGSNDFNFGTILRGESAAARVWTVTNEGDLSTGTLTTSGNGQEFSVTSDGCAGRSLAGGQSCTQLVAFTPQGNGQRGGTINVSDGSTSVALSVRGVGQPLPGVGAACLDGRCAGTASCENHSNGQSLVCCAQNCTGNQRCSENQAFQGCELPRVGQGQGCGTNVLCNPGLTCDASTGTCCTSGCGGACRFCNQNGTCGVVPDGQRGGCGAGLVCSGNGATCSAVGECTRDSDCTVRGFFRCVTSTNTCACRPQNDNNKVRNGGFDSSLGGWVASGASRSNDDSDGCTRSGSVSMPPGAGISQCVTNVVSGVEYNLGYRYMQTDAGGVVCFATFWSDSQCQSMASADFIFVASDTTAAASSWRFTDPQSGPFSPPGTVAIKVECSSSATVSLDQIYLNAVGDSF